MTSGNSYKYKVADSPSLPLPGQVCASGYTNWDGASDIVATSGKTILVVEVDENNRCVGYGQAEVTAGA